MLSAVAVVVIPVGIFLALVAAPVIAPRSSLTTEANINSRAVCSAGLFIHHWKKQITCHWTIRLMLMENICFD